MEKIYIITFENGYCGCNMEEEFEGTYEEAQNFAEEYLDDYAEQYAYVAFGWDEEYDKEEYEQYRENCGYNIKEKGEEND